MMNASQDLDYNYEGYYTDDYSHHFAPCEKTHVRAFGKVFLPILYSVVSILGVVGNVFLIIFLIRSTKNKKTVSVFLLNMAVSDILFALTLPFWTAYIVKHWIFGLIGCKVITMIYTLNMYSSIFFITCVSLDAYLQIVWGGTALAVPPWRLGACALVWVLSLLATLPSVIFVDVEEIEGQKRCVLSFGEGAVSHQKIALRFLLIISGFLIPFLAMVFFYMRISCVLNKSNPGKRSTLLKLALLLIAVFFVLWFPYSVVLFLHALQDLHVISDCATSHNLDFAMQGTESLAFIHACLNPILYAFVNRRVQRNICNALKTICQKGRENSLEASRSTSPFTGIELTTVRHLTCD
ncbi:atypical chemokine receptor 2 isoform X2 [Paramormyrops kingsleyae]|uniref:Atypical chemokine receptor 2 n=2 Tax=Paramormyrops kingsleyae TaxID=1676925 RepID=A0A3B3RS33_9TELE|nr:atypical chemokine receptor 2-like isoform X2 [Paramormyrops kingsleyae]XP_023671424.1 atypical chemokine receptor 2-like isoform X2 [Paramormyrops kingsleyae]XP_023671425.1 atypical chemokine receptor 2-like isoform X2 [Paramormyrops kingsleyae]XP_023671426.1 atypical chemokine receptor 2-like isoform X2 [Paramormyrops kingsleyae]XP_023671427.1 atypical chemokine receptor 2-like isoform X2 [Paramormyrops kingsleyae]XP_023671428.1 atypical chemokine receptor 2-like isoform X2 [Paramormyrops